jgi:hypothetical protein
VALADLLLAASALVVTLGTLRLREWPRWPRWATPLALFWAWALLGGVVRSMGTPFGFSRLEFAKSFAKLTFYGIVAVLVVWGLRRAAPERIREVLLTLLAVNAGFAILLYAAMLLWPQLPYDRFLPGSLPSAFYFEQLWFGERPPGPPLELPVLLRARGLSSEPSHLGYIQAMGLGFLLLGRRGIPPRLGLRLPLVVLSILLTFSLTAYALLAAVLLLASPRLLTAFRRSPRAVLLGGALLGVALLLPPVAQTLHRAIVVRTTRLLDVDDSSRLRIVGSWEMAFRMARDAPVVGTGLGNFETGLAAVREDLPGGDRLGPETQGWNVVAHVLAVTGTVGLLLFLLFLAQLVARGPALAALFFLGCIVQGSFLAAPFWVCWVAYLEPGGEGIPPPK